MNGSLVYRPDVVDGETADIMAIMSEVEVRRAMFGPTQLPTFGNFICLIKGEYSLEIEASFLSRPGK